MSVQPSADRRREVDAIEGRAKAFGAARGLIEDKRGTVCLHRLIGKRHMSVLQGACPGCRDGGGHGYMDHARIWKRDGKVALITGEPYELGPERMDDLLRAGDEFGLDVCVRAESFYFPGRTVLVTISRPDDPS